MEKSQTTNKRILINENTHKKLNEALNGEKYVTLDEFEKMWLENIRKKYNEMNGNSNTRIGL